MDDIIETEVEIETKPVVETKVEPVDMESWKSQTHQTIEVVQWLRQGLGLMNKVAIEDCMQTLVALLQKVYDLGEPKSTNEVGTRSISPKQKIAAKTP